jgi:hypothetical protein
MEVRRRPLRSQSCTTRLRLRGAGAVILSTNARRGADAADYGDARPPRQAAVIDAEAIGLRRPLRETAKILRERPC